MIIKKWLIDSINKAFDENEKYINKLCVNYSLEKKDITVLDVGCGDGSMTRKFLTDISLSHTVQVYGIDREKICKNKDIIYKEGDLEAEEFPYPEDFFDIVISNQVIEHLLNKDHFLSECFRVLRKDGLVIVSTENIASLDNIFSLLLGNDPVSQHTGSKYNVGSFLSPHFMEEMGKDGNKYSHKNVCSYRSLVRIMRINGFNSVTIKSFGHFGIFFKFLFPMYGRLITATARKCN